MQLIVDSVSQTGRGLHLNVHLPLAAVEKVDPEWLPEKVRAHAIEVPWPALLDRARVYGLATPLAALVAILREHYKRLNDVPDGQEAKPAAALLAVSELRRRGGLRQDVSVTWAPGVLEALAALGVKG